MKLIIPTRANVHLISYIIATGGEGTYQNYNPQKREFTLESEHSLDYWRSECIASHAKRVDEALLMVRNLIR